MASILRTNLSPKRFSSDSIEYMIPDFSNTSANGKASLLERYRIVISFGETFFFNNSFIFLAIKISRPRGKRGEGAQTKFFRPDRYFIPSLTFLALEKKF